jgi:Type II secretion system (T2SS), protein G
VDPWGNNYRYVYPGDHSEYDLFTFGRDNQEDTQSKIDEDADIVSWAEASLIGTWFEYTPTSAIDISFNETLPTA